MNDISIINLQAGPLPIVRNFSVPNGSVSQVLIVSGSAWSTTQNTLIQVEILIEDSVVGTLNMFSNGDYTHRTFPPALIPLRLPPDNNYTLTLRIPNGSLTTTDVNDFFSAMLLV